MSEIAVVATRLKKTTEQFSNKSPAGSAIIHSKQAFKVNTAFTLDSFIHNINDYHINDLKVIFASPILWNSQVLSGTYVSVPIERGKISSALGDLVSSVKIKIGNVDKAIGKLMIENDIRGCRIIIKQSFADIDYSKKANWIVLFDGYIDDTSGNDKICELNAKDITLKWNNQIPHNLYSYMCRFRYKDSRCGRVGLEAWCNKTKKKCEEYGNEDNYGGFEDLPKLQARVVI